MNIDPINDPKHRDFFGFQNGVFSNMNITFLLNDHEDFQNIQKIFWDLLCKNQLWNLCNKSKTTACNSSIVLLTLIGFQSQLERSIIHGPYIEELKEHYDYIGLACPITESFFQDGDLRNSSFTILKNYPWSIQKQGRQKEDLTKQNKKCNDTNNKENNNSCLADYMMYATNIRAWNHCISNVAEDIKHHSLKYFGCRLCVEGYGHFTSPLFLIGNGPLVKKISSTRTSLTSSLKAVQKYATEHKAPKLIRALKYVYILGISMMQTLIKSNLYNQQELMNHFQTRGLIDLNDKIYKFFNFNNVYKKAPSSSYCHVKFYDPETMNKPLLSSNTLLLQNQQQKLKHIANRPCFVLLTEKIAMESAHPNHVTESKFWIPLSLTKSKQSHAATQPPFIFESELPKVVFQSVTLLCCVVLYYII